MIRICHVIGSLHVGGAELMLARLLTRSIETGRYDMSVICLSDVGETGERLRAQGVRIYSLNLSHAHQLPGSVLKLRKLFRALQPDIVQTWMYHANLIGGVVAKVAGVKSVIWGIRGTGIPQSFFSVSNLIVILNSFLSHFIPTLIVCCGTSVRDAHRKMAYSRCKMVVVRNGYNLSEYVADKERSLSLRKSLKICDDALVVGVAGRYDPSKDFGNFLRAVGKIPALLGKLKILMIGKNLDSSNTALLNLLIENSLTDKVVLMGQQADISAYLDIMDVFCLSSCMEGFPNVVCEAMAMSTPCVVTDVGDAALIVGDTGIVVPPEDPSALSRGLIQMLSLSGEDRARLGALARERIASNYTMEMAMTGFELVYGKVLEQNSEKYN